jgi:hypothetical protein
MSNGRSGISSAFQIFLECAPKHAGVWMTAVQALGEASALDKKTSALAYSLCWPRSVWTAACRFM